MQDVRPSRLYKWLLAPAPVLAAALAYFLTAQLSLWIAAPIGSMPMFWLATGVGIASVYLVGRLLLIGVWLGAYCAALVALSPHLARDYAAFAAMSVSIGAVVQTWAAVYLLHHWVGPMPAKPQPKSLQRFLAAMAATTWLSATIGTATLSSTGVIHTTTTYLIIGLSWWFGDFLGAALLVPLLITVWRRTHGVTQEEQMVPTAFRAGIGLSLLLFMALLYGEKELARTRFEALVPWVALLVGMAFTIVTTGYLDRRQRVQVKLQASEQRYRQLVENSHDLVQRVASNGRLLFVNQTWINTLGYDAGDSQFMTLWDVIYCEQQERCRADLDQVLAAGTPQVLSRWTLLSASGEILDMEGLAVPDRVSVNGGGDAGCGLTFRLAGSGGEADACADPCTVSIFLRDVSERLEVERIRLARYSVSAILAQSPELDDLFDDVLAALGSGLDWPLCDLWWRNAQDENLAWRAGWYKPHSVDYEVVGAMGRLRQYNIAEGWASPVWTHKKALWFPDLGAFSGQDWRAGTVLGLRAAVVIPVCLGEEVLGAITCLQTSTRPVETPLLDALADLGRQIGQYVARRQAETALRAERASLARRVEERTAALHQANSELQQALRAKDAFLANVSHELRTPLHGILALSESLAEQKYGTLNDRQLRSTTLILQSGQHLLSLINDILDLAKVEVGKLEIDFAPVPLRGLCDASLVLVREMATKKQVNLALSVDDEQAILLADARRLKQILVNLLSNAVKFTQPGGNVRLMVSASRLDHQVQFAVHDDGIGIPPDKMGQLFKPFTQLDTGLARQFEGAGLGLALVRRLVELHGGCVHVESAGVPGEGSCFTVVLPWREPCRAAAWGSNANIKCAAENGCEQSADKVTPELITVAAQPERTTPSLLPKAKILIAEDNQLSLQALGEYLTEAGYQLTLTSNGAEAVERAQATGPDLILMDVQMPVMDGLEAIRRLRADSRCSTVRIVALTALAMAGDRERCLAAGADDYVSKPFLLKDLEAKVESMLVN